MSLTIATSSQDGPAVIVLNMHYTGLGVARALRGSDTAVWGLSFGRDFIGNRSRYCKFVLYPDPARDPSAALSFLKKFRRQFERPPIIVPTRDLDIEFLLKHRAELEGDFILSIASTDIMQTVLDKSRLFEKARNLGIFCPKEVRVECMKDLESAQIHLRLPCIVKPIVASQWRNDSIYDLVNGQKALIFQSWDAVFGFYRRLSHQDPRILVQEFIEGGDVNLCVFGSYFRARDGLVRYFTARKVFQAPPLSGTGLVVEALPNSELVEQSIRLLKGIGYTGISEIEYKWDSSTGRYALIEINPRHWDQHALGVACGVNLTHALYCSLVGDAIPHMEQAPKPIVWIAEESYLVSLRDALRGSGYSLREYLRPLVRRKAWATFSLRDPGPMLAVLRRVIRDYFRAVQKIFRHSASKS